MPAPAATACIPHTAAGNSFATGAAENTTGASQPAQAPSGSAGSPGCEQGAAEGAAGRTWDGGLTSAEAVLSGRRARGAESAGKALQDLPQTAGTSQPC